jgi:hypothetical protein
MTAIETLVRQLAAKSRNRLKFRFLTTGSSLKIL